jgi:tetratricopeptide (TPR) repeat protein
VAAIPSDAIPSTDYLPSQPVVVEEGETRPKAAARKRKRTWLLIGGALVLLCLCSLVLLGPVRQGIQANATATAEASIKEEPPPPPDGKPELAEEIAAAEERLAKNPDDAVAHLDLAWLYMQAGKVDAGEEQMREAVALRPEEEWLYMDIGRYLLDTQQTELAAETFVIGLEVLPDSKPLHFALAELYFQDSFLEQNPDQAEGFAHKLVEEFPDDPLFHTLLAHALIRNDKMDEARTELDMILQEHPDMAEAHLINGLSFRKNRQPIQARREYRLALELAGDREWLRTTIERELASIGEE